MSRYFEDFEVGQHFQSRGRTVTEAHLVAFAGLSGDFIELHTNEEYARQTVFGARIAPGALIFSMATGLAAQMELINETVVAFYGLDKLRFTRPVFIGDTIRVEKRVVEKREKGEGRGLVTFDTSVLNQKGEPVLVFRDKLLIRKRAG